MRLTAGCGSWQTRGIWVVCEPLPPSWAPWLVGWAERECGNGCPGSRESRGCCNRFCLQTLAAHLEFAHRGRQGQGKQSGYASPSDTCLVPGPPAAPTADHRQGGTWSHFLVLQFEAKSVIKGNFLVSQKDNGLCCLNHW